MNYQKLTAEYDGRIIDEKLKKSLRKYIGLTDKTSLTQILKDIPEELYFKLSDEDLGDILNAIWNAYYEGREEGWGQEADICQERMLKEIE